MADIVSDLPQVPPNSLPPLPPRPGPRNEDNISLKQEELAPYRPYSRGTTDDVSPPASDFAATATSQPADQVPFVQYNDLVQELAKAKNDLKEERQAHWQTTLDLRQKEQTAAEFQRYWRDAINELNRYLRLSHGNSQMTDDILVQHVNHLRQSITAFSAQCFSDKLHDFRALKYGYGLFKEHIAISQSEWEGYMRSASLRANLIQAFLWGFINSEIFGKFCWMTDKSGSSVYHMYESFGQLYEESEDLVPDARQKCSMWRANTCNLMLDTMELQRDEVHNDPPEWVESVETVSKVLSSFSRAKLATIRDRLQELFAISISLDQAISRQVAMITWDFGSQIPSPFDPTRMVLEGGSQPEGEKLVARLVLAPGLLKRGRASGDRFDETTRLLNTMVSCEFPVYRVARDQSHGGPSLKPKWLDRRRGN
ncbi:hypothetical protein N7537_002992 [Penicillium hordei]|uniref:Uncharacterized protein n=1 Tax=Penicillium hordei TaxID=40994 RepID=A0AAD6H872_9EURO|nr:uncharacterized protein N7537_002992 [Penicillium hordei]KAJ5617878.1 hypothetical protein N7537_002992 [Penicillium hordei]